MITKFERKVIAGLTAFLMCLSMVLAVPVSVNAEAEQTQDEAVSGAKQEETVSDVQMQDETVNDAQQDVTTGEEVEEGAAGDIQKLPGMSAESTDAMLNTTSQEDVIGSITLKKDGTEESGSIMLQEDQTSVRYQLNVEEDGQYYITATGDNYWSTYASITEETEDGTQDVEIINSRVELRKAGTYYLELSDYSSESQKIIKWKAGKVKDITPGEFDIELNEEKPEAYYRLTVDESGVYYVRSVKGMSVKIRDTQTGNEILSSSSFYKLKKENVYEITLGRYSWENASGKWGILKGIEKEVECDKVYINETGIEIPDSVTNIGDYAFVGCEKLNKVTVPASVTKIGEKALGYLTSGKGGQAYKLEGFTIRGVAGSAAEKYAKENEFNFEAYTPEYIRGDVDADRKVSIGDVRMTLRSICKKAELNGTQKLAADVEKDGTVDIKDLRKILRYVCGKIEYL